jgi:hypothetical protein
MELNKKKKLHITFFKRKNEQILEHFVKKATRFPKFNPLVGTWVDRPTSLVRMTIFAKHDPRFLISIKARNLIFMFLLITY